MKILFEYQLKTKVKEDFTEELEPGKKTITTKIVEKPVRVILKEPSRLDITAAQNVYEEEWSSLVRRGILPRSLISKKFRESNGIFTDTEIKALEEVSKTIEEIKSEYKVLLDKENKTKEDEDKIKDLVDRFNWTSQQLDSLDEVNQSIFQHSVETLAEQKSLIFNILNLSFVEFTSGKVVPYVYGDNLDEKLEALDKIAADDSTDEAKEKARLYDEILVINTEFLKLFNSGKITRDQFSEIKDKIENPDKSGDNKAIEEKVEKEEVKTKSKPKDKTKSDNPAILQNPTET